MRANQKRWDVCVVAALLAKAPRGSPSLPLQPVFSFDSGNEARPSDATTAHRKLARQRLVMFRYVRLAHVPYAAATPEASPRRRHLSLLS